MTNTNELSAHEKEPPGLLNDLKVALLVRHEAVLGAVGEEVERRGPAAPRHRSVGPTARTTPKRLWSLRQILIQQTQALAETPS